MSRSEADFRALLAAESVEDLDSASALNHLGRLIDLSLDFGHVGGTDRAIQIGNQISNRTLTSDEQILLDYFLSNAWDNKRRLLKHAERDQWLWEQPEAEKQI